MSPYIAKKIQELQEDIVNGKRRMILLTWNTGEKMRVFLKNDRILSDILNLQENYTSYYNRPFKIQKVVILEEVSKNRLSNIIPNRQ